MIHLDIVLDRIDSCSDHENQAAPVVEVSKSTQQGCDLSAPVYAQETVSGSTVQDGYQVSRRGHLSPILRFSEDDHF